MTTFSSLYWAIIWATFSVTRWHYSLKKINAEERWVCYFETATPPILLVGKLAASADARKYWWTKMFTIRSLVSNNNWASCGNMYKMYYLALHLSQKFFDHAWNNQRPRWFSSHSRIFHISQLTEFSSILESVKWK